MKRNDFDKILINICSALTGKDYPDERSFQRAFMQKLNSNVCVQKCFSIETEETHSGFPDCFVLLNETEELPSCALIEFKCIRKGFSKFRPMQLPFKFKYNSYVAAYSKDTKKCYIADVMPGTFIKEGKIYEISHS